MNDGKILIPCLKKLNFQRLYEFKIYLPSETISLEPRLYTPVSTNIEKQFSAPLSCVSQIPEKGISKFPIYLFIIITIIY